MKVNNNKSRRFKTAGSPKRTTKSRSSFNADLSTNYELMLRLYLINKELASSKEELKYYKLGQGKKIDETKAYFSSPWNNIIQVINKANQLIQAIRRPKRLSFTSEDSSMLPLFACDEKYE